MTVKDLLSAVNDSADILIMEREITHDCPIGSDDIYEGCRHENNYRRDDGVYVIDEELCEHYDVETESCSLGLEEHWDYRIAYFGRSDGTPIKLADKQVLGVGPYTHETRGKSNKKITTNVIRIEVE